MPTVFRRSFLHIPVCGRGENIAADNPIGGVPDSHFGTKYYAAGANFIAQGCTHLLTKWQ
ncbi:MAG: hypothetical protein LBH60_03090 [Prevotellaceae bacterium]|jgi:hypothetical protein|nr:hypothetical protein [Prevotellaceae bacterium]